MVARPGREFAVAHGAQLPAERLLGDGDAELLKDPLRQIDQPPAHHSVNCRDWATLDHLGDRLALTIIELGGLAWRLAVQQTVGAPSVEPQHPVPDDLQTDAADLRCLGAGRTVVDRGKGQKPTGLWTIFGLLRQTAEARRCKIPLQWYRNRHGEPPSFATLNQIHADLGIPDESRLQGFGIRAATGDRRNDADFAHPADTLIYPPHTPSVGGLFSFQTETLPDDGPETLTSDVCWDRRPGYRAAGSPACCRPAAWALLCPDRRPAAGK